MKSIAHFIFLTVASIVFLSCERPMGSQPERPTADSIKAAEAQKPRKKVCKLESMTVPNFRGQNAVIKYVYQQGRLSKNIMYAGESVWDSAIYVYNEVGVLSEVKADNVAYLFDPEGRLMKIQMYGGLKKSATFEYDDTGRIVKQISMDPEDEYSSVTMEYKYDSTSNPISSKTFRKGKLIDSRVYSYDDKINPMKKFLPFTICDNCPVQFAGNNNTKQIVTYEERINHGSNIIREKVQSIPLKSTMIIMQAGILLRQSMQARQSSIRIPANN